MTFLLNLNVLFLCRCVYCSCQAHSIWYLWWCVEGPQCNRLGWACSQSCSLSRQHSTRTCKQRHHGKCHAGTQNLCLTDHGRYQVFLMWYCPWFISNRFIFDFLSKCQSSADAPYIARHVGLRCGIPIPVPALTVNRLCGSGFQSIISGAQVSTWPKKK